MKILKQIAIAALVCFSQSILTMQPSYPYTQIKYGPLPTTLRENRPPVQPQYRPVQYAPVAQPQQYRPVQYAPVQQYAPVAQPQYRPVQYQPVAQQQRYPYVTPTPVAQPIPEQKLAAEKLTEGKERTRAARAKAEAAAAEYQAFQEQAARERETLLKKQQERIQEKASAARQEDLKRSQEAAVTAQQQQAAAALQREQAAEQERIKQATAALQQEQAAERERIKKEEQEARNQEEQAKKRRVSFSPEKAKARTVERYITAPEHMISREELQQARQEAAQEAKPRRVYGYEGRRRQTRLEISKSQKTMAQLEAEDRAKELEQQLATEVEREQREEVTAQEERELAQAMRQSEESLRQEQAKILAPGIHDRNIMGYRFYQLALANADKQTENLTCGPRALLIANALNMMVKDNQEITPAMLHDYLAKIDYETHVNECRGRGQFSSIDFQPFIEESNKTLSEENRMTMKNIFLLGSQDGTVIPLAQSAAEETMVFEMQENLPGQLKQLFTALRKNETAPIHFICTDRVSGHWILISAFNYKGQPTLWYIDPKNVDVAQYPQAHKFLNYIIPYLKPAGIGQAPQVAVGREEIQQARQALIPAAQEPESVQEQQGTLAQEALVKYRELQEKMKKNPWWEKRLEKQKKQIPGR